MSLYNNVVIVINYIILLFLPLNILLANSYEKFKMTESSVM